MEQTSSKNRRDCVRFVFLISLPILALLNACLVQATDLTGCAVITTPGNYNLTKNVIASSSPRCFEIKSNDVTLDCLGNSIQGIDTYDSTGIYADHDNFTLKNCAISDWYVGIKKEGSNNGVIRDSNFTYNSRGISLANSENNRIFNSIITENTQGVYISFSEKNVFYNNLFKNTNNTIFVGLNQNAWNAARQIGTRIYSKGTYMGGNYWSNPLSSYSESCADANNDGFCDEPYTLDAKNADYFALSDDYIPDTIVPSVSINYPASGEIVNTTNISISVSADDLVYAYTNISISQGDNILNSTAISQKGTFIATLKVNKGGYYNITATAYDLEGNSNSITVLNILTPLEVSKCSELTIPGEIYLLDKDISYNGGSICINIQADDVTLDCLGRSIIGKDATYKTYGISLNNRKNITLRNCAISGWTYGIFSQSSQNNIIRKCYINKNKDAGIYLYSSSNNHIYENVIANSTSYGMILYSSNDNNIYNNRFDNEVNVLFEGENQKNYWNTKRKPGSRAYSLGKDIGGNFWTGIQSDFSKACTDIDTDGFCDDSYNVETASTYTGSSGSNIDYLPMSDEFLPDKTPPATSLTIRLPGGSIFNLSDWTRESYVNVTLNCSDNASGCLKTFYCYSESLNCTPATLYKGPFIISLDKNQTKNIYLNYFSVDDEYNNETIKNATIRSLSSSQRVLIESPSDHNYSKSVNLTVTAKVLKPDELNYTVILLQNSSGHTINSSSSNANGTFSLNFIAPGEGIYTIVARYHSIYGFATNESSITLTVDTTPPTITAFNFNPSKKVKLGEKITAICTATDNYRGTFSGIVSALDTGTIGTKSASCTATDLAGNSITNTETYEVWVENCVPDAKRCNAGNIEICTDNEYVIYSECDYMCTMKNGAPVCIDDPGKTEDDPPENNDPDRDNPKNSTNEAGIFENPTLVAAGCLLTIFIVGSMAFVYIKLFQKPKKDFSKKMAIIEAKIRDAEGKGKNTSDIRSEFGLAQADIDMGLFEMAEPRLKKIENSLKKLK